MSKNTEYFEFLDDLRESGATNTFGAPAYVEHHFGVSLDEAKKITSKWMDSFDPSKTAEERAGGKQCQNHN